MSAAPSVVTPSRKTATGAASPRVRSLDDLARLSPGALRSLYEASTLPDTVHLGCLDGDCVGRMLAVRGTAGPAVRGLARLASSPGFPWEGKSFAARDARRGDGINRVKLGGRHRLFPFTTSIGASVLDGAPAIVLDYDLADNPGVIRAIHDEVREVAPGLFFGPACWKRARGGVELVLWFGLEAGGASRVTAH